MKLGGIEEKSDEVRAAEPEIAEASQLKAGFFVVGD